ncbi:MAG: 2Fe-2S iron-sulfur cluster binding domain-containing protein [Deltaproteobacteria bacterium]|nr:2Fe-2S iron-sulfur cluster binding domain-containing protein [Deltaproteobacteria bacterium]
MDFQFGHLITSVLIVSGIATVLSILIVIADATIGNYGDKKITINNEKEIIVDGGQTLLSALKSEQIFIPSACGGRGSCGLCKLKIESGAGEVLPTELPFLEPSEITDNVRLCCQVKVKADLEVTVPEELFKIRQFEARCVSLVDLTADIKGLRLELSENDKIEFKAGQFIQLEVPVYDLTPEAVYRAYSIASKPDDDGFIDLEIKYVPGGICTTWVHKFLKVGDTVKFNGPYGDFYLRDTDAEMICMAVGSGMAPIKSILTHMAHRGINRKVKYFYGARKRDDLYNTELMEELEKLIPDFNFIPVLSRPEEEDNWSGKVGRLNNILPEYYETAQGMESYLCGNPDALNSYIAALKNLGLRDDEIFYDPFA